MPSLADVRERLAALAAPGGGWGYQPGRPAHPEPTCLAALALTGTRHESVVTAGLAAIEGGRLPDGSYRLARGRPEAAWPTALVLFTRHALGQTGDDLAATAGRLLALKSRSAEPDDEAADMAVDIDLTIRGWGWAENNFAWVEPTAWACLALRRAGFGDHPRVREGLRLLIDRAFDSGGANYGNRVVLGRPTEPIPGPTAVMLLALQGVSDEPRVEAAKGYLRVVGAKSTDLEHLAWARLALAAHDTDAATRELLPELDGRIAAALGRDLDRADGLGAGPYRLALAALALDAGRAFRIGAPTPQPPPPLGEGEPGDRPPLLDRIRSRFRGWVVRGLGKVRPLPPTSAVHVARADSYESPLADILAEQFDHFRPLVPLAGKRVVLKPNLVEYHRDRVINTDPRVVDAVITLCEREGAAEVVVAEGPGHWRNVQFLVNESGLGAVLGKHGVRFVDLNHDEPVKLPNLGRLTGLDSLYLARTVAEAEVLISLPKLKTHHWAGATLSLKNLFGTLPGICYGWPKNELHWRGIPNSIVDIALTRTPDLAIVDGVVGMEGDGPLNGTAKPVGAVVMGADLVAVDATCCRLIGLPPERLPTLHLAAGRRLGRLAEADIPQLGVPIRELATAFEWPPGIDGHLLPVRGRERATA
jgi:uncharacterized protein (DUF362 family)